MRGYAKFSEYFLFDANTRIFFYNKKKLLNLRNRYSYVDDFCVKLV